MINHIPSNKQSSLKEFKYKGSCESILYKYAWSPLGEFLINYVPLYIAPNVITLIAFVLIIICHLLFMFQTGQSNNNQSSVSYSDPIDNWKYIMFGVTLFLYQHLDNLDGKQARRTKNSTPIGMLFDHGADAISAMLIAFQIFKAIQYYHMQYVFYFLALIIMIPNLLGIWTQYGTGHFTLQIINPIDQGLPVYQISMILGAFYDYSFWNQPFLFGTYSSILLIFMTFFAFATCIVMCKNVLKQTTRSQRDMLFKLNLIPILIGIFVLIEVCALNQLIYEIYYFRFFYGLSFFWTRNIIYMQICGVCNMEFKVLNIGTVSYLISLILMAFVPIIKEHIAMFLTFVLLLQGFLLLELIISFLNQASNILQIKLFSINTPKIQNTIIESKDQKSQKKLN